MTINEFIEKSIEGGYTVEAGEFVEYNDIFLDPLAWKAVGKVKGWSDMGQCIKCHKYARRYLNKGFAISEECAHCGEKEKCKSWEYYFIRLPQALIDGKTLTEYISTL